MPRKLYRLYAICETMRFENNRTAKCRITDGSGWRDWTDDIEQAKAKVKDLEANPRQLSPSEISPPTYTIRPI